MSRWKPIAAFIRFFGNEDQELIFYQAALVIGVGSVWAMVAAISGDLIPIINPLSRPGPRDYVDILGITALVLFLLFIPLWVGIVIMDRNGQKTRKEWRWQPLFCWTTIILLLVPMMVPLMVADTGGGPEVSWYLYGESSGRGDAAENEAHTNFGDFEDDSLAGYDVKEVDDPAELPLRIVFVVIVLLLAITQFTLILPGRAERLLGAPSWKILLTTSAVAVTVMILGMMLSMGVYEVDFDPSGDIDNPTDSGSERIQGFVVPHLASLILVIGFVANSVLIAWLRPPHDTAGDQGTDE